MSPVVGLLLLNGIAALVLLLPGCLVLLPISVGATVIALFTMLAIHTLVYIQDMTRTNLAKMNRVLWKFTDDQPRLIMAGLQVITVLVVPMDPSVVQYLHIHARCLLSPMVPSTEEHQSLILIVVTVPPQSVVLYPHVLELCLLSADEHLILILLDRRIFTLLDHQISILVEHQSLTQVERQTLSLTAIIALGAFPDLSVVHFLHGHGQ